MQFNVSYAPPAFIRLLRRERIAPLLQKQPHAGGCGAFRWNEVPLAGDGEVHRDGLADPNGGRGLIDVMHAILVWEIEIPVALGPEHLRRHIGAVSYLPIAQGGCGDGRRPFIVAGSQQQCQDTDRNSHHCVTISQSLDARDIQGSWTQR